MKNIFIKQNELQKLEAPKTAINQSKNEGFIESLKIVTTEKRTKRKIETLICEGDGLGIQKKMTY